MPTDPMTQTLPSPSETSDPNVQTLLESLPLPSGSSSTSSVNAPAFLLDAVSESEPADTVVEVWMMRLTAGFVLIVAAIATVWLAWSSFTAFTR